MSETARPLMSLTRMPVVTASITATADGALSSNYIMIMLLSLVLGGIVGELLRIDRMFDKVGDWIKRKMGGAGEGGNDPRLNTLGNEVTALYSDEFQSVMGGAYVLAPQCPTFWMQYDEAGNWMDNRQSDNSIVSMKNPLF